MPNHEVPGLLFFQMGVFVSLRMLKPGKRLSGRGVIPLSIWCLIPFASWHATISGLIFILVYSVVLDKSRRRGFLLVSLGSLVFGLLVVVTQLLWANDWQPLASQTESLLHWMKAPEGVQPILFRFENLKMVATNIRRFYADIPWLLSIGWMAWFVMESITRRKTRRSDITVIAIGAGSFFYSIIFAFAARVHAYQQFYLLPYVSLSSAFFLARLRFNKLRFGYQAKVILILVLAVLTFRSSIRRLQRIYGEPGEYAVRAVSDIECQFE